MAEEDLTSYVPSILRDWWSEARSDEHREADGTLVFCDLSGFTALNERLSRHGKVGAELMSEIITSIFTTLLDAARARGGDMLKFGGDAILLLFIGRGHVRRAAIAATEMRRLLRTVGRVDTPSGRVRLGMSMGVHTGVFDLFLVGGRHRELVVMGPGVTTTVEMESAADAGEILLSAAAAEALGSEHLGPAKGPGFLLGRTPTPADADQCPLGEGTIDAAGLLAPSLGRYLLGTSRVAEHRLVTVAFVHLTGADALLAARKTREMTARLGDTMSAAQETLERHGVTFLATDAYHDGTKIMASTGAPIASGTEEDDMLLAMIDLVGQHHPMGVRVGVHRGHAFAGDVGPLYRRTYTILGDTTNTAARVMAKAGEGVVLATPAVLDHASTRFDFTELAPFPAKGKTEPLVARSVRRPIGTREVEVQAGSPFVGREEAWATVSRSVEAAADGRGGAVRITAEPGLGKSRFVHELELAHPQLVWAKVGCGPYVVDTPYFALRELVRKLFGNPAIPEVARRLLSAAPDLVPWLPLLAAAMDEPWPSTPQVDELDPSFRTPKLHAVLTDILRALVPAPSVLVVEDAHWIDEASAQALCAVAEAAVGQPWLIVTTVRARPAAGPLLPGDDVELAPLDELASTELARHLGHRHRVPPMVVEELVGRAAGNPFFLEQLIAAAAASGPDAEGPPGSIEKVLVAKIDRLPDGARAQLREAAVLGVRFHADALGALLVSGGRELDWPALSEFVQRDDDDNCTFRQTLIREVAYEGLSFRLREAVHRRVATIYEEQGAPPDLLAIHCSRGRLYDRAWNFGLRAARAATAKQAHADSAGLYRLAIDAGLAAGDVASADLAACWEALGDASEVLGRYDDAARAYHSARRLAPQLLPELLRKEGLLRERTSRYTEALRWYRRGMRVAERPDTQLGLALAYAGVRFRQGKYAECIRWASDALADAQRLGVEPAEAHALHLLHLAHITTGNPRRRDYRGRAVPIYERLGDLMGLAKALNNVGLDAYWEGDWDEALRNWYRSLDVMRRTGDVVGVATLDNNIGEVLCDQARFEEAQMRFLDALTASEAAGYPMMATMALKNLGRVAARRGDWPAARPLLEQAGEEFRRMRAEGLVVEVEALLAECDVLQGRGDEALPRIARAIDELQPVPVVRAHLERLRGLALLDEGALEAAGIALRASLDHAERAEARFEVATTLAALARWAVAANSPDATELTRQAEAAEARLGLTPPVPI